MKSILHNSTRSQKEITFWKVEKKNILNQSNLLRNLGNQSKKGTLPTFNKIPRTDKNLSPESKNPNKIKKDPRVLKKKYKKILENKNELPSNPTSKIKG